MAARHPAATKRVRAAFNTREKTTCSRPRFRRRPCNTLARRRRAPLVRGSHDPKKRCCANAITAADERDGHRRAATVFAGLTRRPARVTATPFYIGGFRPDRSRVRYHTSRAVAATARRGGWRAHPDSGTKMGHRVAPRDRKSVV